MFTAEMSFDARLDGYLDLVGEGLRTATQRAAFARYFTGLMSPLPRKSIEPIAAACSPRDGKAEHKRLHHFVADTPWSDRAVRRVAVAWAIWGMQSIEPIRHTIVDDTGFLKQGRHSVGVARQYTGSAGKIDNCQVAVSLAVGTSQLAMPVDMRLYLPIEWCDDLARRNKAKVPHDVEFTPKWQIALEMLRAARADGVPLGEVVLADADYGRVTEFRTAVADMGLHYGVGVHSDQHVHHGGVEREVREIARRLPAARFRSIRWRGAQDDRDGTATFAFCRVRIADEVTVSHADGPEAWLVIEKRHGAKEPERYYLSTRSRGFDRAALVTELKARGQTEHVYQDLKNEFGLDHFEGRGWVGWNHHVFGGDVLLRTARR